MCDVSAAVAPPMVCVQDVLRKELSWGRTCYTELGGQAQDTTPSAVSAISE